jgi:hypothetical protein
VHLSILCSDPLGGQIIEHQQHSKLTIHNTYYDNRNPINAIRHQFAADLARQNAPPPEPEEAVGQKRPRPFLTPDQLTPQHTAYWAEGFGKGGDKPWKFDCICGEKCSSYENYRYHPVGRMYECTHCSLWSHVECVLGSISDDDLEELPVSKLNLELKYKIFQHTHSWSYI